MKLQNTVSYTVRALAQRYGRIDGMVSYVSYSTHRSQVATACDIYISLITKITFTSIAFGLPYRLLSFK